MLLPLVLSSLGACRRRSDHLVPTAQPPAAHHRDTSSRSHLPVGTPSSPSAPESPAIAESSGWPSA
eukprot:748330-Hanusia_phi.AAC.1